MNALEQAVIDAALNVHRGLGGIFPPGVAGAQRDLWDACTALLAERERIAAKPCVCMADDEAISCESATCRVKLGALYIWVLRTWVDVREGDVIRPPGNNDAQAIVVKRGPVNHWHVAPNANQYRPHESAMEWSSIDVTLQKIDAIDGREEGEPFTPANGMKPDAAVEIQVTRAELAAIEASGGWNERVGIIGA